MKLPSLRNLTFLLIGVVLTTVSQAFFLIPNRIVPSGLVGVGTVLYHGVGLPIGMFTIIINLFLIALQAKYIGPRSSAVTVFVIVVQGLALDLLTTVLHVPRLVDDVLLASIYGGVLTGTGLGFIFKGGGTLGGTDIIAQILYKFKQVPFGTTLLSADVAILVLAGAVYGPHKALYAMIKSYIVGQTVDRFLEGNSDNRQVMIISRESETIAWGIIEELHRGVTYLDGRGAYSGKPVQVLLAVVRKQEVPALEELVRRLDEKAFLIVSDARQVLGKGFEGWHETLLVTTSESSESLPEAAPA